MEAFTYGNLIQLLLVCIGLLTMTYFFLVRPTILTAKFRVTGLTRITFWVFLLFALFSGVYLLGLSHPQLRVIPLAYAPVGKG